VSPLVLAVDTTHESGSLALARGDAVIDQAVLHEPSGFAHVLYGHLEALLERNGVALADIDCFAAASGPGSFTGVRVGLACVKGLAEALGKPAMAVSNLQALASLGTAPLRAVAIDARRGEIYGAVYDAAGTLVRPETVGPLEEWQATLPPDAQRIGPDLDPPPSLAGAVARIAARRFRCGEAPDPAALDANYVRRPDAELFWKD
jgi:tRNA threonylcarbamoyladenosine biosynthesis protein TsaB